MTVKEFKIWLIEHDMNQKQLAAQLEITDTTISNYVVKGKFPKIFQFALKGISAKEKGIEQ